jgi:hypothetical protein
MVGFKNRSKVSRVAGSLVLIKKNNIGLSVPGIEIPEMH